MVLFYGKTFGESDVPFAITVLVKFVTDVFNLFTICSFWIDDGIIVASNTNNKNWITEAETIRQFTVWMFSNLCLKMNERCDLKPTFEKPWVGCFNSANFVYTKAKKILQVADIFLEIIQSGTIKFSQAEKLHGKISHLCDQNSRDPSLRIMKSILNTVVRLFNEDPTQEKKSDTFYVSQGFADWCVTFLNKMSSHLHLKTLDKPFIISIISFLRQPNPSRFLTPSKVILQPLNQPPQILNVSLFFTWPFKMPLRLLNSFFQIPIFWPIYVRIRYLWFIKACVRV